MRRRALTAGLIVVALACGRKSERAAVREAAIDAGVAPPGPAVIDAGVVPELVRIDEVSLEQGSWPAKSAPAQPDGAALRERLEGEITLSNLFLMGDEEAPAGAPVRRARIAAVYGFVAEGKKARAAVSLTLKWRGASEDPDLAEGVACDGKPAEARELVECAVSAAVKALLLKERARRGEEAVVLDALASDDDSLRAVALGAVGAHQMRVAVPRLMVMLDSPNVMVRDGAIGALVALRESRAVSRLTQLAPFRDVDTLRRTIDAVGAIGGEDARAWLELVASGHDDPVIRRLASDTLARMR